MILLLGGTSETAPLALRMAIAGYRVLVSTATEIDLDTGEHPGIERRIGRLDDEGFRTLIDGLAVRAIVDATHPFARAAHETASRAAMGCGVPYLRYERPETEVPASSNVIYVPDHASAAIIAVSFRRAILLTIGSRNLRPYLEAARDANVPIFARVLPHPDSVAACLSAGLPEAALITARGPFSVEENREAIRQHDIGVIVSKDSGAEGGVPEKIEAARIEGCRAILVRRPEQIAGVTYGSAEELVDALLAMVRQ